MDIDRLSPQENERRKKEKLCFDCRKPGHFASAHRDGTLPAAPQQGNKQHKGKGKQLQRPFKKQQYNSDQVAYYYPSLDRRKFRRR